MRSESKPTTAFHLHDIHKEFSEKEVIEMYLNNKVTSAQQVLIYNIEDQSPK